MYMFYEIMRIWKKAGRQSLQWKQGSCGANEIIDNTQYIFVLLPVSLCSIYNVTFCS